MTLLLRLSVVSRHSVYSPPPPPPPSICHRSTPPSKTVLVVLCATSRHDSASPLDRQPRGPAHHTPDADEGEARRVQPAPHAGDPSRVDGRAVAFGAAGEETLPSAGVPAAVRIMVCIFFHASRD